MRVVAGAHGVEAERDRPVEHGGELDPLVAAQARVGGAPGGVLGDEVVDHLLLELLGEVPDVERDPEDVGHPAGVTGVVEGAAAARAGPVGLGAAGQREVDADDIVPGVDRPGRRDGGVDAAGEGGHDAHVSAAAPSRPGRPGGRARPPARGRRRARPRRPAVEVRPSEKRRDERAVTGSAPIASSTWLGWAIPAEHAEPVEHSTPAASRSSSSASPSQPGNEKCALPGSRPAGSGSPFRTASGTTSSTAAHQGVAQRAPPAPSSARRSAGDAVTAAAAARPAIAGVSSVPERTSRSWPPPWATGTGVTPRPSEERADTDRPAELVARTASARRRREAAKSTGRCPTACTASVWKGRPCSRGQGGQRGDRLDGADLVVGPHHADERDRAGVALDGGPGLVDIDATEVVDGQPLDLGALVVGEPLDRVEDGVVLDGAGEHPARGAGPRRGAPTRAP